MPLLLIAVLCGNGVELSCIYHSESICTKLQMLIIFSQENIGANFNLLLSHSAVTAVLRGAGTLSQESDWAEVEVEHFVICP